MNATELKAVVEKHGKWLRSEEGGSRAVLRGADLSRAVLSDAVLRGAVLRGAVLSDAVLRDADLSDAVLSDADLSGAVLSGAVLRGAVLSGAVLRGAVLRDADLRGAVLRDADLSDAVLRDAKGLPPIKVVPEIRAQLLEAVSRDGCRINMANWHTCDTVHCLAGWVVTIHPEGRLLEAMLSTSMNEGTATAATLILHACGEKVPDFFDTDDGADERAMNWLRTGKQVDPELEAVPS